jgi:hypothetical protein
MELNFVFSLTLQQYANNTQCRIEEENESQSVVSREEGGMLMRSRYERCSGC